jgi:hypothetical protein
MHLSYIISLCLAAFTVASFHIVQRDVAPVIKTLDTILSQLQAMMISADAFDGDVIKASEILTGYEEMLNGIVSNNEIISKLDALRSRDAIPMLEPGSQIVETLENLVNKIISKKALFEQNSLSSVVEETFTRGKKACEELLTTILAKLPTNVHPVVNGIKKQLYADLDKGMKAFAA